MKAIFDTHTATPETLSLLNGEKCSRRLIITTGQSEQCKDVFYVLYSFPREGFGSGAYLGNLSTNLETAIINARKKIANFEIEICPFAELEDRLDRDQISFGKYRGLTIAEIFDKDESYIYWLSKNTDTIRSKKIVSALAEYAEVAKMNIIQKNKATSQPALPVSETKQKFNLTVYAKESENIEVPFASGYQTLHIVKAKDEHGNKFYYKGTAKDFVYAKLNDTISFQGFITKSFEAMGVTFNVLSGRKAK